MMGKSSRRILEHVQIFVCLFFFPLQVRVKMPLVDNFCDKSFYAITYHFLDVSAEYFH